MGTADIPVEQIGKQGSKLDKCFPERLPQVRIQASEVKATIMAMGLQGH